MAAGVRDMPCVRTCQSRVPFRTMPAFLAPTHPPTRPPLQFAPTKALPGGPEGVEALAAAVDLGKYLQLTNMDLESLRDEKALPQSSEARAAKEEALARREAGSGKFGSGGAATWWSCSCLGGGSCGGCGSCASCGDGALDVKVAGAAGAVEGGEPPSPTAQPREGGETPSPSPQQRAKRQWHWRRQQRLDLSPPPEPPEQPEPIHVMRFPTMRQLMGRQQAGNGHDAPGSAESDMPAATAANAAAANVAAADAAAPLGGAAGSSRLLLRQASILSHVSMHSALSHPDNIVLEGSTGEWLQLATSATSGRTLSMRQAGSQLHLDVADSGMQP